jgi:hypothetical protein
VESRTTTHFAQNFQLYQMAAFETMPDKSFQKSKMGSYVFSKNHTVQSSLKVSNILQSIEDFESYRNHCLHLIQLFVFIEKKQ